MIERQTRYVKLVHLPAQDSATLRNGLVTTLEELPEGLRQSLTWDQGTEMARHLEITTAIGTKIFFCDAASPWQRGSNENANGLPAPVLPEVDRPFGPHPTRPREGRERAERPSATHPRRPRASRAVQRIANVLIHPEIAMTPGNQADGRGSDFGLL